MSRTSNTQRFGTSGRTDPASDETATSTGGGRTPAEGKLWAALSAHPEATAAELAIAAGIGKSTAGKFLAGWATDGSVTRAPGTATGGRRAADRWRITDNGRDKDPENGTPADSDAATAEPVPDEAAHTANGGVAQPTAPRAETTEDIVEPIGRPVTVSTSDQAQDTALKTGGTPARESTQPGVPADLPVKAARLRKGALRGMVEDFLRDHPADECGPNMIATALRRSAGAVFNALEKLVTEGWAVRTCDAPKRYRYHERDAEAASEPDRAGDTAEVAQPDG